MLDDIIRASRTEVFHASAEDFKAKAIAGWPFWRGFIVGFLAAFPIGYLASGA